MKIWNMDVKRGADGSKHLDIQMHGVIDGVWGDDGDVSSADVIAELNKHADAKTIGVRINSVGGSAFGGVAMYNALQAHAAEVMCTVEGLAASAASLVAMAGKTRMGVGSMMMIHPPLAMAMGNAVDLRKTADVLDKVQEGIAAIYTAKTGLSAKDVSDLVNAETWMTAEEAVASGFADEVMPDVKTDYAPGEQVPSEQSNEPGSAPTAPGNSDDGEGGDDDEEEDGDDSEDAAPVMIGEAVRWRGVEFPIAHMPQRILNMAKTPPRPAPPVVAPTPALALVPPPAPPVPLSRAEIELRAPEVIAAFKTEAHAAGVAAERARLQAIDELNVQGCADLIAAAKYVSPSDAPTLAMAVVKAGKVAGSDLLAMRRIESGPLAAIAAGTPDSNATSDEARHIQAMIAGGNARRGEKR